MQREGPWRLGVGLLGGFGCLGLVWLATRDADTPTSVSEPSEHAAGAQPQVALLAPPNSNSAPSNAAPRTNPSVPPSIPQREGPLPSNDVPADSNDESAVMAQLRDLRFTNPRLTLAVTREADERFGESSSAPERNWFQARALVELQRFDEAKAVAQSTVENYPDDDFALDLRRHLLSYPLGLPPREH